jgi:hypothetical protein
MNLDNDDLLILLFFFLLYWYGLRSKPLRNPHDP